MVWGFTAVLGKVITLAALPLVAWRMALTSICLFFMARAWRTLGTFSIKQWTQMAAVGMVIAFHWLAFYGSVKLANASIGVLCMALAPIFSALLAPWLSKSPFSWRNLFFGLSVLPGMLLVVGGVDARFYIGIAVGALSALLAAAFGLMNKELVAKVDALTLSFIEISIGGALMWLLLFCSSGSFDIPMPTAADWPNLLIFALFCTALPFAMSNVALKQISAFSAQFAVNLEPIYGIVFAAWLLHETKQLTPQFYIGASVILLAVFAQVLISVKARRT